MEHAVHLAGYSIAERKDLSDVVKRDGSPRQKDFGDWADVCLTNHIEEHPDGFVIVEGRIPRALSLADQLDARLLIISTGATWHEGVSEAKHMFDAAIELLPHCAPERDEAWLRRIVRLDEESTNTATGFDVTRRIIIDGKFNTSPRSPLMMHFVSSWNHEPRVVKLAYRVFSKIPNVIPSFVPASTSYGRKTPDDVVIHELGEPPK